MKKQVLFLEGGGDNGYQADKDIVTRLKKELGVEYQISYPEMKTDEKAPDFGWLKQIEHEIGKKNDGVILVAHSFGASMLLKLLSERQEPKKASGIFLLATPFWNGNEEWKKGFKLQKDFAESLPENCRLFFFYCRDDQEVPLDHMKRYKDHLPSATFVEIAKGGHQFEGGIDRVATSIKEL